MFPCLGAVVPDSPTRISDERRRDFFITDNAVIDEIAPKIGAHAFLVYSFLLRTAGNKDKCFPGYSHIAKKLNISRPTAIKAIAALVESKLIRVEERYQGDTKERESNLYRILPVKPGSKRDLPSTEVVNEIDHGGKGDLPQVVNDVYQGGKGDLPEEYELKNTQGRRRTEEDVSAPAKPSRSRSKRPVRVYAHEDPYYKLAERLRTHIRRNHPKHLEIKEPQVQAWANDARLMTEADKRDLPDSERLLDWCQVDSFWQSNIMSMDKFRKKWDTLYAQMVRDTKVKGDASGNRPHTVNRERVADPASQIGNPTGGESAYTGGRFGHLVRTGSA